MSIFIKQLQSRLNNFLVPDRVSTESQELEFILQHNTIIVWTADSTYNLVSIKGSLSPSSTTTESMKLELQSFLQSETKQLSQLGLDNPIMFKHQLNAIPVETNIKQLYDRHNQRSGIMGVTQHCTAQLVSNGIQKRQAQALGNFLEAASHDLRTPLSVINTSLFLIENSKDEDKRNERLQLLKQTIGRLQVILDNMFLMARIDAMPTFVTNPIQLGVVLHNVVTNCKVFAHAKNVELNLCPFDILPTLNGHETQLQTAISNIVENAIQNTASGGYVEIHTAVSNNNIAIKIVDNGKGISAEDLPYVFERFYRVDKFRPTEETRIGLGLSIANTVIEKHNGHITIDSQLGKGTTVVITLPT